MKIRFLHPADARLSFAPGDEIAVTALTPEIKRLLSARRIDNQKVCEVVRAEDEAHDPIADDEVAVTGSGTRRTGRRG